MSYKEDDKPKDLIKKYWADGCHLIPCGSTRDPIPEYFRKKHPFEDDFGLARKWAKTPRVKWSEYIKRKPNFNEN